MPSSSPTQQEAKVKGEAGRGCSPQEVRLPRQGAGWRRVESASGVRVGRWRTARRLMLWWLNLGDTARGIKRGNRDLGKRNGLLRSYPAFAMGQISLTCFVSLFISLVHRQDKGKPPLKFLRCKSTKQSDQLLADKYLV